MPKKKITPAEEPEQTAGLMEQAGEEATAPPAAVSPAMSPACRGTAMGMPRR